ncbi:MAG: hypothetical protein HC881_19110 [Leptolyngbyaceae cyanobacterium SL_7_1]|nr:hypothetical protein [Leptolyngbyaceae cyanobacterium SL_7_1]
MARRAWFAIAVASLTACSQVDSSNSTAFFRRRLNTANVTEQQIQTCKNQVGIQFLDVPMANIEMEPVAVDDQNIAELNWKTTSGAVGTCRITENNEIVEFVVQDPGGSTPNLSPLPNQTGTAQGTQEQLQSCQTRVADTLNIAETDVRVTAAPPDSQGNTVVNWQTTNGGLGYCRVNSSNEVIELVVQRRDGSNTGSPTPTPTPTATASPTPTPPPGTGQGQFPPGASIDQLRSCRNYVASVYTNISVTGVEVNSATPDNQGNAIVTWRTITDASGYCRMSGTQVIDFIVDNPGSGTGGGSNEANRPIEAYW